MPEAQQIPQCHETNKIWHHHTTTEQETMNAILVLQKITKYITINCDRTHMEPDITQVGQSNSPHGNIIFS
jgi:hypothetical protein